MISVEPAFISFLSGKFPEAKVSLGVGISSLDKDTVITVSSNAVFPMGDTGKHRGAQWVVDFQVFNTSRSVAYKTAYSVLNLVEDAIDDGVFPDLAGWKIQTLPISVSHDYASQTHKLVSFALSIYGYYGAE